MMDILSCFDPLGNATHTALSFDILGEDILITGAGPIGCMAVAISRHAGARHIVVTDVNPYRLALAEKMGATLAVDVTLDTIEVAQERLGTKEGFDVGLEMSGNPPWPLTPCWQICVMAERSRFSGPCRVMLASTGKQ